MPIINGQKVACAPCIRGHRSTKCNHFHERVMLPVRKPGRPLSTCPCPPGRPCACGGLRVAIPKKQKCGCPTEDEKIAQDDENKRSPVEPPTSPSRPSFRVAKTNSGSKVNGRKQSFDLTNLERMDPRSINVIAGPGSNGITNGMPMTGSAILQSSRPNLTGFGAGLGVLSARPGSTYASPQNSNLTSPLPYNMGFGYPQSNQLHHAVKLEESRLYSISNGSFGAAMASPPFVNGNHAHAPATGPVQPAAPAPEANVVAPSSSCCCGSKPQEPTPAPAPPPPQSNAQLPQPLQQEYGQSYMPPPSGSGSCCSRKKQEPAPAPAQNNTQPSQLPQQGYGQSYMPPPSASGSCCSSKAQKPCPPNNMPSSHQPYGQSYIPQFPYPTVFRYPGDYGSWQHPIDPFIWQQVASQTSMSLGTTPMSPTATNGDAVDVGTSHQCSCGEGCQCIGCLAHPFNAQMFQYVNNAYSGSNGSSPGGAGADATPGAGGGGGHTQTTLAAGEDLAGSEAPTPAASNEGSPKGEEQSLSTMDYFFVNLPISGLCGGELESCPCGDSCDCPGCLVHHIPLN
ncbi:hypothetical protein N657DRAFT_253786 [Parathielavia appendiculata]|uniref:Copper-fist domain-containing protein n=1 Tax=Parathielavia appendiculata TaxID=2587402 RepID=A0AAN6TT15_9PEZI|nr:hypothetical protein N657DRAFT_253786 [Parathielavia appendiculata]